MAKILEKKTHVSEHAYTNPYTQTVNTMQYNYYIINISFKNIILCYLPHLFT